MVERKNQSGNTESSSAMKEQWGKQIELARELILHGDYQQSLQEYQKVIQDI